MTNQREQLLDEIEQIQRQYKDEVPGKRRAWPRSIKTRIQQMHLNRVHGELIIKY